MPGGYCLLISSMGEEGLEMRVEQHCFSQQHGIEKNGNVTPGWSWVLNSLVVLKVLYQYFYDKCLI